MNTRFFWQTVSVIYFSDAAELRIWASWDIFLPEGSFDSAFSGSQCRDNKMQNNPQCARKSRASSRQTESPTGKPSYSIMATVASGHPFLCWGLGGASHGPVGDTRGRGGCIVGSVKTTFWMVAAARIGTISAMKLRQGDQQNCQADVHGRGETRPVQEMKVDMT